MLFDKTLAKALLLSFLVSGLVVPLGATYYQDTLFPIGLTGINGTGGNPPYSNVPGQNWVWQATTENPQGEDSLIFDLGINCIGCQDAKPVYLIDLTNIFA